MNELINIHYDDDKPCVMGRELHEFLEVETRYNDWFKRMCEYDFTENIDFYSFLSKTSDNGRLYCLLSNFGKPNARVKSNIDFCSFLSGTSEGGRPIKVNKFGS